jgi:type VI secretion system secreted protein VgrG
MAKVQIDIDGTDYNNFVNLTVKQSIYTYNEFKVVYRMDSFEKKDNFVMEQSKKFIGSVIKITIETKVKEKSYSNLFKGLITSINTSKSHNDRSNFIILSGYSPDILLRDNPGCSSFENKTLKQIADEVLKPYPKDILKAKTDPVKSDSLLYTVRYNENRYEFLRRQATRFGEWFFYDGTQLILGKLPDNKIDLKLGMDLNNFAFSIKMNPLNFSFIAYDRTSASPVEINSSRSGGKDNLNQYGGFAHEKSIKEYSQQSRTLYNHLNVPDQNYNSELRNVVTLEEDSTALSMSVMKGSSLNPQVKPGSKVNIKAPKSGQSGEVDYGEYIITSLSHTCDSTMNYRNSFSGIPSEAKIPDYTDPRAIPYCETQSAVVKDNNDPDKLGRVRVNFFWQGKNDMSPWLRPVNAYSGADRGFYFIPEVGDEVLVGFEGDNAEKPFLMGSMYHGKNKPKSLWPDKDNNFKGIITRGNLKIEFDDKKKITTIETPAGNKVVLNDDGKSILLEDQNRNKVELSSNGVIIESIKDIKISSKAKITIEGTTGVDISSKSDAKITGMNIDLNANVGLTAKGNATAELSAAGQTTVKGAIVMIN